MLYAHFSKTDVHVPACCSAQVTLHRSVHGIASSRVFLFGDVWLLWRAGGQIETKYQIHVTFTDSFPPYDEDQSMNTMSQDSSRMSSAPDFLLGSALY